MRICRRCICSQAKKTHVKRANPSIDRIVRVDHAGELGADRIYAGQMAILGRTSVGSTIQVRNFMLCKILSCLFIIFIYFFLVPIPFSPFIFISGRPRPGESYIKKNGGAHRKF